MRETPEQSELPEKTGKRVAYVINFSACVLIANIQQNMEEEELWRLLKLKLDINFKCGRFVTDPRGLLKQSAILVFSGQIPASRAVEKFRAMFEEDNVEYYTCLLSDFLEFATSIAQRRRPYLTLSRDCEVELLNINPEMTEQELLSLFSNYGIVVEATPPAKKCFFKFHRASVRMSSYVEALRAELCLNMEQMKGFQTCVRTGLNVDRIRCLAALGDELTAIKSASDRSSSSEGLNSSIFTHSVLGIRSVELLSSFREHKSILNSICRFGPPSEQWSRRSSVTTQSSLDRTTPISFVSDFFSDRQYCTEASEISSSPLEPSDRPDFELDRDSSMEFSNEIHRSVSYDAQIWMDNYDFRGATTGAFVAEQDHNLVERDTESLISEVLCFSEMISTALENGAERQAIYCEPVKERKDVLLGKLKSFFSERMEFVLKTVREQNQEVEIFSPLKEGFQWVFEKPEVDILKEIENIKDAK